MQNEFVGRIEHVCELLGQDSSQDIRIDLIVSYPSIPTFAVN